MGASLPKQYLDIAGKPVLAHTLAVFDALPQCCRIMIAVGDRALLAEVLEKYPLSTACSIVDGGPRRQDSVANMLTACPDTDDTVILVHDAARPCVSADHVLEVVDAIVEHGAALLALPVRDTVKRVHGHDVISTLDRDEIWLAQTPQGARLGMLRRAFQLATDSARRGTDDAELLEQAGYTVKVVQGSNENIKITFQEDLEIAAAVLRSRERRSTVE
jgi:2-C-methyl-D-erythritol 4-phosphate cytidylyltransferase